MGTKFYVELPADEFGNVSMLPMAVVEATVVQGGPDVTLTNPARPVMIPVAPAEIVQRYPNGWYADSYGGWAETEGPARLLSREERLALIARQGH